MSSKLVLIFVIFGAATAQYFDPVVDDKTYLDRIEEQIQLEVESTAADLVEETKVAEKITKAYINTKLKDNVFKALRTIVERSVPHSPRQESTNEGDNAESETDTGSGGDDDVTEKATTPLNGLSTAVKINENVFKFIGDAIKTIFKGVGGKKSIVREEGAKNEPINEEIFSQLPNLMKKTYGEQLVGILDLLKKENKNPIQKLFNKRERSGESDIMSHIEELIVRGDGDKLPNLYAGIPAAKSLLESMEKVRIGIRRDIGA